MNNADISLAFRAIIADPGRGACLRAAVAHLTDEQLTDLFDTVISGDLAELGRLVESYLKPIAERHVSDCLKKKVIFDNKGDNEI